MHTTLLFLSLAAASTGDTGDTGIVPTASDTAPPSDTGTAVATTDPAVTPATPPVTVAPSASELSGETGGLGCRTAPVTQAWWGLLVLVGLRRRR